MTSLRQLMTEDMRLAGFTPGSQRNYLMQKVTLAELVESLSQPTDEDSLTESDSLSETESRTPCCPHCGSDSTVLVEEVSRHGRR